MEHVLAHQDRRQSDRGAAKQARKRAGAGKSRWTDELRQLYDSVVAEPLPDSFDDLLKKLDQAKDD